MALSDEIKIVKQLGDQMGYGHLMALASAIWRKKLEESGVPVEGAFVPTINSFIKKDFQDNAGIAHYDKMIETNGW